MISETVKEQEAIYSYQNKFGQKYWTPNVHLAQGRAQKFGTDEVHVKYYDVEPLVKKEYTK